MTGPVQPAGLSANGPLHGVAVALAIDPDGPRVGVLILGRSGAGKSLLALEAIEACPWRRTALIADDAVFLSVMGGRLMAGAGERIRGLLEVRGVGPVRAPYAGPAPIDLAVDLDAPAERTPEAGSLQAPILAHAGGFPPEIADRAARAPLFPFLIDAPARAERLRMLARAVLGGQAARRAPQ